MVLDVGCGTGVLSCFAARAGAAKVIGVDRSDIVLKARDVVRDNGFDGIIHLVQVCVCVCVFCSNSTWLVLHSPIPRYGWFMIPIQVEVQVKLQVLLYTRKVMLQATVGIRQGDTMDYMRTSNNHKSYDQLLTCLGIFLKQNHVSQRLHMACACSPDPRRDH